MKDVANRVKRRAHVFKYEVFMLSMMRSFE